MEEFALYHLPGLSKVFGSFSNVPSQERFKGTGG
jgi:hypothetical protein